MKTRITRSERIAAGYIRKGDIAAFPTETVYGLGADALSDRAVRKIFRAKGRPHDNPLIVHIAARDQLSLLASSLPRAARLLIDRFFPGPLTVIVRKTKSVPAAVTAGLPTVAIRMPDHPVARKFLKLCGRPVAAPSANRSGHPSPTTWHAVETDLGGLIPCILRGGRSRVGLESTVVDCTAARPVILRTGAIPVEQLRKMIPSIRIHTENRSRRVKSPGMKYRHYAPAADVVIVRSPGEVRDPRNAAYIGIDRPRMKFRRTLVCRSSASYAHRLYAFFRLCDREGIQVIYCQQVASEGLGTAVMDRLRRAAHR